MIGVSRPYRGGRKRVQAKPRLNAHEKMKPPFFPTTGWGELGKGFVNRRRSIPKLKMGQRRPVDLGSRRGGGKSPLNLGHSSFLRKTATNTLAEEKKLRQNGRLRYGGIKDENEKGSRRAEMGEGKLPARKKVSWCT